MSVVLKYEGGIRKSLKNVLRRAKKKKWLRNAGLDVYFHLT